MELVLMNAKIQLLYLITEYSVGGAEKGMVRILSGFNRDKYDITVVALRNGSGKLLPELEKIGIKTEILGAKTKYDFLHVAFHLYKILKKLDIQILICSLYHPTILGRIIGKLTKTPVIINWEHAEIFGGFFRKILNKITIPFSDKIICDSEKVGVELKKCFHLSDALIRVIPIGGINLCQYLYNERELNKNIEIGSVGRLTEQKGYIYLLKAVGIIKESRSNVNFSIIGDGPDFNKLQKLIEDFNLSDKIKLMGFHSDIPNILSKWHIYIQPSLWEGLCITVVEAIASGLPVVATNVGGIPESVIDGYNGFLVPPKDPKALAEKIIELVDNPELRTKMGERSRKIAEEKYSLDNMVNKIEELVDGLIEKNIRLIWNKNKGIWESDRHLT
jgi:glycosyltransferase involved in cell wall biosynthesis